MKHPVIFILLALAIFSTSEVSAQAKSRTVNTSSKTQKLPETEIKTTTPPSKVDKNIDEVDSSVNKAKQTADKTHQAVKDFIGIFGSKTPNEASVVIPAIEFEDANLELLLDAIRDRKEVKKANLEYTDGTAVIKLILKPKAGTEFWSELPKELKDLFKMRSKKENNILVEYKPGPAKTQFAQNK